jgi:hypothetical protein
VPHSGHDSEQKGVPPSASPGRELPFNCLVVASGKQKSGLSRPLPAVEALNFRSAATFAECLPSAVKKSKYEMRKKIYSKLFTASTKMRMTLFVVLRCAKTHGKA